MRRILLIALAVISMQQLQAQTEKGGFLLGVNSNVRFTSQAREGVATSYSVGLAGDGAYFLIDNLAVGVNVGYGWSKRGDIDGSSMSISPSVRYYIDQFFLGARFGVIRSRNEFTDGTTISSNTTNDTELGLQAGYAFFLNEHIAVEPTLNYQNFGGDFPTTQIFSLRVGFTLYLPKSN